MKYIGWRRPDAMSQTLNAAIAVIGIDIGKNSFHISTHDERGAIVCARNGPVQY